MDILPSEEEQLLKNAAREFLEAEVSTYLVREMELDENGYPPDLWRQMADLGWLGLAIPEEYGGQGLPLSYLGMVMEEVGRVLAPVPLHSTMVAALTVAEAGTEGQKRELLPAVCSGDMVMTWGVIERDPRLIPSAIVEHAQADGRRLDTERNEDVRRQLQCCPSLPGCRAHCPRIARQRRNLAVSH